MDYLEKLLNFKRIEVLFHDKIWMLEVFVVVFLTLLLHSVQAFIFHRLRVRMKKKTESFWGITLFSSLHRPIGFLIWVLGISFAAEVAMMATAQKTTLLTFIPTLRELLVLVIVIWGFVRLVRIGEKNYIAAQRAKGKSFDITVVHVISQLLVISIAITGVLVGMPMLGFSISGLVAFGGIGSAGLIFAAKDVLANFFGGMMIYLDRPFKVGDWIRSPDRQIEGTVELIGWRLTRIRTFDKRPLYVPNNIFSTISVENPSRMQNRRIYTTIGLRYDDATKVDGVLKSVEEMLRSHPEIDTTLVLMVNLVAFGPSSLDFMIYTFTKTTDWVRFQAIQQDVFLKTIDIITAHGAQCAFPTQTLHVPDKIQIQPEGS